MEPRFPTPYGVVATLGVGIAAGCVALMIVARPIYMWLQRRGWVT